MYKRYPAKFPPSTKDKPKWRCRRWTLFIEICHDQKDGVPEVGGADSTEVNLGGCLVWRVARVETAGEGSGGGFELPWASMRPVNQKSGFVSRTPVERTG